MSMSIEEAWPEIRGVASRSLAFAFATVDADGTPRVTPVGSVYLHRDQPTGYYLEHFTSGLRRNLERDGRFSLLLLDPGPVFWLRSLWLGRFERPPSVRLLGRAGPRRPSSDEERERWLRRVRLTERLPGHRILWQHMPCTRELVFERFEPVRLGAMTRGHWQAHAQAA